MPLSIVLFTSYALILLSLLFMTGHSGYDSAHKGLTAYLIIRQTFGSTAKRENYFHS